MKLNLRWNWEVRDKSGLVVARHPLWEQGGELGHSFLQQMLHILFVQMEQVTGPGTSKDTGGTDTRAIPAHIDHLNIVGSAALAGIVVGTGTGGVLMDNFALGTLIADGGGGTQLDYGATTFESVTIGASTAEFIVTRSFANNSGGNITITEVGLYTKTGGTPWYFCIARDKLASTILITDTGATANVKANLQIDLT